MKFYYKCLVGLAIIIIGLLAAFYSVPVVKAADSYFTRVQTNIATTTPAYLVPGGALATSTFNFGYTHNIDEVDLFVQLTSSTTATVNIAHQFSNNNIDWFTASTTSISGTSSTVSRTVIRRPSHAANYQRAVFYASTGNGNSSVWAEASLKRNAN